MIVTYDRPTSRFLCLCPFEYKHIPKQYGFRWDGDTRQWFTLDPLIAGRLFEWSDPIARSILGPEWERASAMIYNSSADTTDTVYPAPEGLAYLPFQNAGIEGMIAMKGCILADEMGIGKTIQAIGLVNALSIPEVLIICPSFLKLNWRNHLSNWLLPALNHTIGITNRKTFPATSVVITNYEQIYRHRAHIYDKQWPIVIIDEGHYIKNSATLRTRAVKKIIAERKIILTGTPMKNKPVDVWSLANYVDPQHWPKKSLFNQRYLAMDHTTPINLDELNNRLRSTCMIRREKSQVLPFLPKKTRSIIELPADGVGRLLEGETRVYNRAAELDRVLKELVAKETTSSRGYEERLQELKSARAEAIKEWKNQRRVVGMAKVPLACKFIESVLDEKPKVVIFCHHHEVIQAYCQHFREVCELHYGDLSNTEREYATNRFQNDSRCRVLIAGISTAIGYDATAADTAVFTELSWVPGDLTQAEDRLHRIGQFYPVSIQHLVLEKSVDFKMAQSVIEKQQIAERVCGGEN